jgi:hypothetical protein
MTAHMAKAPSATSRPSASHLNTATQEEKLVYIVPKTADVGEAR